MALVTVDRERLGDPAFWPDCCAKCAAAGTTPVPVPTRYAKKVDGLTVPLCTRHGSHWEQWKARQRIGMPALLAILASAMVAVWFTAPLRDPKLENEPAARGLTAFCFGFMGGAVVSIPLLIWVGTPLRVIEVRERSLVLSGVRRRFAAACGVVAGRQPLPAVADDATFEVAPYRHVWTAPAGAASLLLFGSVGIGAVLGLGFGVIGPLIGTELDAWKANDWRYYGLAVLAVGGYSILLLSGTPFLRSRLGLVLAAGVTLILAVVLLAGRIVFTFRVLFGIALTLPALVCLSWLFVYRRVRDDRIRNPRVAVLAGLLGPLTAAGVTYLLAGMADGPHRPLYVAAVIVALAGAMAASARANKPYCGECQGWLAERRVGAFARSRGEMEPLISGGAVVQLAAEPVREKSELGEVELVAYSCPECGPRGPVVLELHERQQSKNNTILVRVGRWSYPGAAVVVLDRLFPLPSTPTKA